ncbi:hypothetical protein LVJ85_00515 [Neisseria sp. Dent CA1/247]|uniref:hypothetical protein n=1 Tax=Neisseria sp. Dent CA1/247 TaxID=2912675 RepID=UPI001FD4FBE8|nr:hypothetical protein [Neisseria sp. Dent CA1/247]UOO77038.1 hypothetical protein LVJ85_00515 [Neisseria sp. Dent CA1/247]
MLVFAVAAAFSRVKEVSVASENTRTIPNLAALSGCRLQFCLKKTTDAPDRRQTLNQINNKYPNPDLWIFLSVTRGIPVALK